MVDVLIIGAGVSGCAVARELSRYEAEILVLDKEEDVGCGTSKANSAIVHAGYDCKPGTLMARLNVQGNKMMGELCHDLDIPFRRNGSLVICFSEDDRPGLQRLLEQGKANGVEELEILEADALREMEPNLSHQVVAALHAPTAGIICPFTLTAALAENAAANGVSFQLNTAVREVRKTGDHYTVDTDHGPIEAKAVVNAAGVYAHIFHNQVSSRKLRITPRKGEYCLLDRAGGGLVERTIFPLPGKYGKGILVAPTIHGNTIIGPTAVDIDDPEGTNTTSDGLAAVLSQATRSVNNLPFKQTITSFAGLRAHEDGHEFILGEVPESPGFFDCAGIESPGLTSSPAIGVVVTEEIAGKLGLSKKENFIATRKGVLRPDSLTKEEYIELINREPAYGQVICRCETVTEGEIIDAIRRPLGATTVDGVKRRTRAGMGRCQGGFCVSRVMEILARELGVPMTAVEKSGPGSAIALDTLPDIPEGGVKDEA